MLLKVLFSDVPIEFTAATITIEIPAAMRAYSIAVAPVSSFAKHRTSFLIGNHLEIFVALADNDVALSLRPSELDNKKMSMTPGRNIGLPNASLPRVRPSTAISPADHRFAYHGGVGDCGARAV
jgi:hypothetical protein